MTNSGHNSKIWALFESGDVVTIGATLHSAPKDKGRPIDAYIVTESEGHGFTRAARRAAEAVYKNVCPYLQEKGPLNVAFDLESQPAGVSVAGESAGLAFAIALAAEVYHNSTVAVAATGEITGAGGSDSIGRVRGIENKLKAACDVLPEGGWVLYPQDNDQYISDILRTELIEKGLKLRSVSSVTQALHVLFAPAGERQETDIRSFSQKKAIWLGGLLVFFCIAVAGTSWLNDWQLFFSNKEISQITDTEPIDKDLRQGPLTAGKQEPLKSQNASESSVIVELKSDGPLIGNLEKQMTDRLAEYLTRQYASGAETVKLTGMITMVNIIETTDTVTGELQSEMKLALKDLIFEEGGRKKQYPPLVVRVSGTGAAGVLTENAAEGLLRKIAETLVFQIDRNKHKKKISTEGKGFD